MARKRSSKKLIAQFIECILVLLITFAVVKLKPYFTPSDAGNNTAEINTVRYSTTLDLSSIPNFTDKPYVILNNNVPDFDESLMTTESFEKYSEHDSLGRCGVAFANIGKDLMPTKERESIGMIKPSGWRISKYDFIDGKYLYNRCHLIAYQLTAENANEKNLITCTREMNSVTMLKFENKVANYIKKTKNHVLYRVTPMYIEDNLLASGVKMEALSIEDNGKGIKFNVYVYNVQDKIEIDYKTGDNKLK
jgi:DNA-entry nuclease